jgi:predicted 3-demethylubiquinone-9 3-methyltransferase (glyoxalase superfamily)
LFVTFTINGQPYSILNGGPYFQLNEAVSFMIPVSTQDEIDRYWDALIADGGAESQCGWCKDRFGVSWQVTPQQVLDMQVHGTPEQVGRMWTAMMTMRKLDLATLTAAFEGTA